LDRGAGQRPLGGARVDDASPNTGAGTVSYADRGAFEMRNRGFEANTAG
jgi:hypothetical protein